jgi:hypothetical protein
MICGEQSLASLVMSCASDAWDSGALKYADASTPTTCLSENGDESDDLASLSGDVSFSSEAFCCAEVQSMVKNTFIVFKPAHGDDSRVLRRCSSVPPSARFESFRTIKPSVNDSAAKCVPEHEQCETLESLCQERIQSWAECNTEELEEGDKDGAPKRRGGRVRSGRARQREARRRRMRTPSPEMRTNYCF